VSRFLDRVADAGGALYLLLAGVGYGIFVSPVVPQTLTSPPAVLAQLRDHPPTTTFWIGVGMEALGLACLLLFAARLAGRIRFADPAGWVGSAVIGLAIAAFAVKLASFAPALAALHASRYDAGTVTSLIDTNDMAEVVSTALDAGFVLLAALGALSARALPRWLAGAGVLAGVTMLIGVAVPPLYDSLQLVLFLWLVTTSGWLLLRGSRAVAPAGLLSSAEAVAA
jgi:hypothetical protein